MNLLKQFANDILYGVGGYQDFKYYEMAVPKDDADVALVIWVLKCLANPRNTISGDVLDAILQRRDELKREQAEPTP